METDQFGTILCSRIKKYRFCPANSEEELLKVVARLEKLGKDEMKVKKTTATK